MTQYLLPAMALVCALPLSAQNFFYSPPSAATNWETSVSGTGIAESDGRAQYFHVAPAPSGFMVTAVGFRRGAGTTTVGGFTITTEMVLADTTIAPGTIGTDFAANLAGSSNVTTVFPQGPINIPVLDALTSPTEWIDIPTNAPWMYTGPNLLVDIDTFGVTSGTENLSVDRCLDSTSGAVKAYGQGCGSADIDIDEINSTDNYLPGTSILLELFNAPTNTLAAAIAGFSPAVYSGIPLPLDLSPIGMPGCYMLTSLEALIPQPTDAAGAANVTVPIPNVSGLDNGNVYFQWVYADPAITAPLQLGVTNGYMLKIGPRSCPGIGYLYTFSATSTTGTVTQDNGPILRVVTL
jgi:hypothetical protein